MPGARRRESTNRAVAHWASDGGASAGLSVEVLPAERDLRCDLRTSGQIAESENKGTRPTGFPRRPEDLRPGQLE
jgi:hypothetical protein